MPKFSDKPFGVSVPKDVQLEFQRLSGGGLSNEPLESRNFTFDKYLGDRTTFARMWSPLLVSGSNRQQIIYHTLNDNRNLDYEPNESMTGNLVNELRDNDFIKPKAGITSVSTKTEGSLGTIKRTNVDFIVHNKVDFETIYQPYFLKPGATIVVDFGWSERDIKLYNIDNTITNTDLQLEKFKKFIYGEIKESSLTGETETLGGFVNKYRGKIEVNIGKVTDFTSKLTPNGSYECSVSLTSENASLLDTEITDDNNLKFLFETQFEEILIKLITTDAQDESITNVHFMTYDTLSANSKKEVLAKFYNNLEVTGNKIGVIPKYAVRNGIFYQSITNAPGANKDVSYISYGLFEDLFLNTLISENLGNDVYDLQYNTRDTLIRYDENLIRRQKTSLDDNEQLSLFMYPTDLNDIQNGYNARLKIFGDDVETYKNQYEKMLNGTYLNYKTKVIPLRDLFISVQLITDAFSRKQNVNDALEFIYEALNKDSYEIIKLKMTSLNKSFSALSIQDVNLLPEIPDVKDVLEFDVTSELGIVSNVDFTFTMPKGNLGSMVAIGQDSDFKFYDDQNKDNLSFLQLLGPDKDLFGNPDDLSLINLPVPKSKPVDDKDSLSDKNFKFERAAQLVKQNLRIKSKTRDFSTNWVKAVTAATVEKEEGREGTSSSPEKNKDRNEVSKLSNTLPAHSMRDYYGKKAKINNIFSNKSNSIAPLLAPELNITIYGNSYLNIGNLISINYLPKHLKDRCCFIITGVEQKVDTNWQTTYNTRIFLRPNLKSKIVKPLDQPLLTRDYVKEKFTSKTDSKNNTFADTIKGAEDVVVDQPDINVVRAEQYYNEEYLSKEDMKRKVDDSTLDGRMITNSFDRPKTNQEILFLVAVNRLLMKYIEPSTSGPAGNRNIIIKYTRDEDSTLPYEEISDMFISSFIEDEGSGFSSVSDSIIDDSIFTYFEDSHFAELKSGNKDIKEILSIIKNLSEIKNFNNKYLKDEEFTPFSEIIPNGGRVDAQTMGTRIKKINAEYGQIFSAFGFKLVGEPTDEKLYSYFLTCEFPNLSPMYSTLIIPDWFLKNIGKSVNDLSNEMKEYYNDGTIRNLLGVPRVKVNLNSKKRNKRENSNPGYPFSGENYYKTGPWGTSSSVVEARRRLAQNFKDDNEQPFNTYGEYKADRDAKGDSFNRRKEDWDASPNIW